MSLRGIKIVICPANYLTVNETNLVDRVGIRILQNNMLATALEFLNI